ncbi:hypothetical protein HYU50_00840 [Candidatus Woesearchaeota archaeon]|nr:hypothetical protein [Candidatus Woesearchaeota archaeon]
MTPTPTPSSLTSAMPTEILGQSQTIQWFPYLTLNNWQARIETGSGYMNWQDPNFKIWNNPVTPGTDKIVRTYSQIERIILTIGKSPANTRTAGTYEEIVDKAIDTIRIKYPNLKEIILQPLAAGPNRTLCTIGGETVKTTENLPAIEDAIDKLVVKYNDVKKGLVPLVTSCSEFADSTGHLTIAGRINIAKQNDRFYGEGSTTSAS